jgi:hypothetical protein
MLFWPYAPLCLMTPTMRSVSNTLFSWLDYLQLFHTPHLLPRLTVCSTTHQGKCKQDHLTSKRRSRLASRNVFVTIGGRCLSYNGSVWEQWSE